MKHLLEYNIFDLLADEEERQLEKQRDKIKNKIEVFKLKIEYLKTTGDDSYVKQEIAEYRRRIARLKDSLLSDEQKVKKAKQEAKAAERRYKKQTDQYKVQDKIEKKFQAQLSDRDKAINNLADLQYNLRHAPKGYRLKTAKKIDALKAEYDIKSYEIRKKKLLKLETDILLSVNSLEEAVELYKKLLLLLNNNKTSQKDKREAHKMIHDLQKFYTFEPFSHIMDELFP